MITRFIHDGKSIDYTPGADVMTMGMVEGRSLGMVLRAVYELQLAEQLHTQSDAMAEAKKLAEASGNCTE